MGTRRWLGALAAGALILSGCGLADTGETTSTTTVPTTSTQPEAPTTSTSPAVSTTPPAASTSTTIPGDVLDFGPRAGEVLMVIGVRYDDVLNLRVLPGPSQPIVGTLAPDFMDLVARGETRQIPNALWIAATADGTDGWVNMSYVGYAGPTSDLTASVVDDLGEYPTASSMTELGSIVAESMASEDPASDVVVVVAESLGDLGEVTYDIIGLGDDAVRGLRAHVFGEPVSDGFTLKAVEVMTICARGLTPEGLCP